MALLPPSVEPAVGPFGRRLSIGDDPEIQRVRCVGPPGDDVGNAVTVDVADGKAVHGALGVAEGSPREGCGSVVGEDGAGRPAVADDHVRVPVPVEVGDRQRVGVVGWFSDLPARLERGAVPAQVEPHSSRELVAQHEVERPVAVQVAEGHRPGRGLGRTDRVGLRESAAAVVHVEVALAAVPVRHDQVRESVAGEVRRPDRGGRVPRQDRAVRKRPRPVVDADVVGAPVLRSAPVRDDDLGTGVPVQVGHGDVPRRPGCVAEGSRQREGAGPVIEVDPLVVGPVVPDHQVEVAVPIQIGERRGVGVVRGAGELRRSSKPPSPSFSRTQSFRGQWRPLASTMSRSPSPSRSPRLALALVSAVSSRGTACIS